MPTTFRSRESGLEIPHTGEDGNCARVRVAHVGAGSFHYFIFPDIDISQTCVQV